MKPILLLPLALLLVAGCISESTTSDTELPDITSDTGREKAVELAEQHVQGMDDFINYNGHDLKVVNVLQARCPGCWVIDLEFALDSAKDPARIDIATVKLTLEAWEVVDVVYSQGGRLTLEEAIEIAQNSVCIEQGPLTENSIYNAATATWWIDLDIDKPGCNPACVVDESSQTAEINWRCTGLLP